MKYLFLVNLFVGGYFVANACSCAAPVDQFCHGVDSSNNIALVELIALPDYSWASFKIIDNINKEIPSDTIHVLGQDGLNCGLDLNQFIVGDSLIVNLDHGMFQNASDNNHFEWYISGCWRKFLSFSNGMVNGPITKEIDTQGYEQFKDAIFECIDFFLNTRDIINFDIDIHPNPTTSNLYIDVDKLWINAIRVFDAKGQLVKELLNTNGPHHTIALGHLPSGVYILLLNTSEGIVRKKILKIEN